MDPLALLGLAGLVHDDTPARVFWHRRHSRDLSWVSSRLPPMMHFGRGLTHAFVQAPIEVRRALQRSCDVH